MNYILLVMAVLAGLIVMVLGISFAIRITVKLGWSLFKFVLAAALVFAGGYLIYYMAGLGQNAMPVFLNFDQRIQAKAGEEYNVIFSQTVIDASDVTEGSVKINCVLSKTKVILPDDDAGTKIYNIVSSVILPDGTRAAHGPSDYGVKAGQPVQTFVNNALGKTELMRE